MGKKVYIKVENGIKQIGELKDGVFTSYRKSSKHLYKKFNAWGIDLQSFENMVKYEGLHTIVIHDLETGITYTTDVDTFKTHMKILHHKPHRTQAFLSLDYFKQAVILDNEKNYT